MGNLCDACLTENCYESEPGIVLQCEEYLSADSSYEKFFGWIKNLNETLGGPDPFLPIYTFGGVSNA